MKELKMVDLWITDNLKISSPLSEPSVIARQEAGSTTLQWGLSMQNMKKIAQNQQIQNFLKSIIQ